MNYSVETKERVVFYLLTYFERIIFRVAVEMYGEENVDASFLYKNQKNAYIKYLKSYSDYDVRRGSRTGYSAHIQKNQSVSAFDLLWHVISQKNKEDAINLALDYVMSMGLSKVSYIPENLIYGIESDNCHNIGPHSGMDNEGFFETKIFIKVKEAEVVQNEDENKKTKIYDCFWSIGSIAGRLASPLCSQHNQIGLALLRTTLTTSQIRAGYVHSHCPGFDRTALVGSPFCVGSGDIVKYVSRIKEAMCTNVNIPIPLIQQFFAMLNVVLTVESSAGGPYNYISSIRQYGGTRKIIYDQDRTSINLDCNEKEIIGEYCFSYSILKNIFKDIKKFHLFKFSIEDNKLKIKNNIKDIALRITSLLNKHTIINDNLMCDCFFENNYIYRIDIDETEMPENVINRFKNLYFLFKGNKHYLKIVPNIEIKGERSRIINADAFYYSVPAILAMAKEYIFQNKKIKLWK